MLFRSAFLRKAGLIGEVLGEDATFAVATFRPADLLAIAVVDKAVDDRLAQRPQPMPVTRNAMAAYQNQDLALSGLAAQVQPAADGKLPPGVVRSEERREGQASDS